MNVNCRPLIGITTGYHASDSSGYDYASSRMVYVRAVSQSGGTPVLLAPLETDEEIAAYAEKLDGLVLTGGLDVPPSAYGKAAGRFTAAMDSRRYELESRLVRQRIDDNDKAHKPLLAICLGLQMINVVRGGTLVRDIPFELPKAMTHKAGGRSDAVHVINVEPPSILHDIFNSSELAVTSSHHQAAAEMGQGLKVTASSADGVIEAMEVEDHRFALLVQWHPERMVPEHYTALFGAMIRATSPSASS